MFGSDTTHNKEDVEFIIEDWFCDFSNEDVQHIKGRMKRLALEQYELGYSQGAEDQQEMLK